MSIPTANTYYHFKLRLRTCMISNCLFRSAKPICLFLAEFDGSKLSKIRAWNNGKNCTHDRERTRYLSFDRYMIELEFLLDFYSCQNWHNLRLDRSSCYRSNDKPRTDDSGVLANVWSRGSNRITLSLKRSMKKVSTHSNAACTPSVCRRSISVQHAHDWLATHLCIFISITYADWFPDRANNRSSGQSA